MLGQGARGAAMGAVGGAAEGASDPGVRMEGAGQGAMWGAAGGGILGAAMPALGAAAGAAASKVSDALPAAERKATGLLGRALDRAGVPAERLPQQVGSMPRGSVIGDIDASLRREARAAVNVAPKLDDVDQPLQKLRTRHADRGARIAQGLRRNAELPAGYDPEDVFQTQRSQWLADHVDPLYGQMVPSQGLMPEHLTRNPQMRAALKRAGLDPDKLPDEIDFERLWATRQELKRRMRDVDLNQYEQGKASEAIGTLEGFLEDRVPPASALFSEYRRIKQVEELYDVGRKLGSGDEVIALDKAIEQAGDDPEKQKALQQGLVSWFEGKLSRKGAGGSVARDLMDLPPRTRNQLKTMFGEDKLDELAVFISDELEGRELRWDKLMSTLTGNSTTAQQASDMRKLMGPDRAPQIRDLWNRIYTTAMTNVEFSEEVAFEYGKMLLGDLDDAAIRRITDTMIDLSQSQTMQTFRGTVPTGAAASDFGPSLFPAEDNDGGIGLSTGFFDEF